MRRLYFAATALFWLLVAIFWAGSLRLPGGQTLAITVEKTYSMTDLAEHGTAENCWMSIRGGVYDLSEYLPLHPSRSEVVRPWCGREATEAYNTKSKGRPHTSYADELLARYKIGRLVVDNPQ